MVTAGEQGKPCRGAGPGGNVGIFGEWRLRFLGDGLGDAGGVKSLLPLEAGSLEMPRKPLSAPSAPTGLESGEKHEHRAAPAGRGGEGSSLRLPNLARTRGGIHIPPSCSVRSHQRATSVTNPSWELGTVST